MKNLILTTAITAAIQTIAITGLNAEKRFIPWNAEVRIADENLIPEYVPSKRVRKVYNGPQGGAYFIIRFFQVVISPQDGPNCRFEPVCSAYGRHAIEKHGMIMGLFLAGERIIRCNPYNPPGRDPCPDSIFELR